MGPLDDCLNEMRFSVGLVLWGALNIGLFEWGAVQPGSLQTLAWMSTALMFATLAIPLADSISVARWHRYLITQPRGFRVSHFGPIALIVVAFLGFVGIRATGVSEFMVRNGDSSGTFFYWFHFLAGMAAKIVLQPQELVALIPHYQREDSSPVWLRRILGSPPLSPLESQTPAARRLAEFAKRMGWTKPDP